MYDIIKKRKLFRSLHLLTSYNIFTMQDRCELVQVSGFQLGGPSGHAGPQTSKKPTEDYFS